MSRKFKLVSILLAALVLASAALSSFVQAQLQANGDPIAVNAAGEMESPIRAEDACRSELVDRMTREARKFKLELNGDSLTVISSRESSIAYASVIGEQKGPDLQRGIDVGLLLIDASRKQGIPNGAYKIRIAASKQSDGRKRALASLINYEGRIIKELVAIPLEPQAYIGGGGNCWVGGTYGVCFPAGTSSFQIMLWAAFMA